MSYIDYVFDIKDKEEDWKVGDEVKPIKDFDSLIMKNSCFIHSINGNSTIRVKQKYNPNFINHRYGYSGRREGDWFINSSIFAMKNFKKIGENVNLTNEKKENHMNSEYIIRYADTSKNIVTRSLPNKDALDEHLLEVLTKYPTAKIAVYKIHETVETEKPVLRRTPVTPLLTGE